MSKKQKGRPRTRAQRRADDERIKAKVRHYQVVKPWKKATEQVPDLDPKTVGRVANTHTMCSCWMCSYGAYDRLAAKREARREIA